MSRLLAVAAVLAATSMVVLDAGMANMALPAFAETLCVQPSAAILIVTAYQLALVLALLPAAALGERLGEQRMFQAGIAVFGAGAILCAAAPSLVPLLAARFLQGLGGAAVMALGVALLRRTVSPTRLGAAISWNAVTVALSAAAAPTVGALILAHLDWSWLFRATLPLASFALLATLALPQDDPGRRLRQPGPVAPVDLLRLPAFRLSVLASICCFTATAAGLVALPFHLHHDLRLPPLMIGVCLLPWPLSVALAAMVSGRLSDRLSTGWLCAAGGGLLAVGLAGLALWPAGGDLRPLLVFTAICGLGFGLFQTPNNRNLYLSVPAERSAAAGGLQGLARLSGQTMGTASMGVLIGALTMSTALRTGLLFGALLAVAASLISLLRLPADRRKDAST